MSRVLFAGTLRPQSWAGFHPQTALWPEFNAALPPFEVHRFPSPDQELAKLADARAYRILSRGGLLLQRLAQEARAIAELPDKSRIGIYGALDIGPLSYRHAQRIAAESDPEKSAALRRQSQPPKLGLKVNGYIQLSQLAISLGAGGPLSHFGHLEYGCWHALDQAEFDLRERVVDQAIVCSAAELDDPMIAMRTLCATSPDTVLSEGAAFLLLERGEGGFAPREEMAALPREGEPFFGIADPLVRAVARWEERNRS